MTFRDLLRDTIATLLAHKRRTLLTMFGIAWGIISITVMVAAGEGLGRGIQKQQETFGKDVMIVFAGRTSMQAGGTRSGRVVHWMEDDYKEVAKEAPACKYVMPELGNNVKVHSAFNSGDIDTVGSLPPFTEIRSVATAQGRFYNDEDNEEGRHVAFLGRDTKKQLFAEREALGQTIELNGIPYTVIGVMKTKDQNSSYDGVDIRKIFIPFNSMKRDFPNKPPAVDRIEGSPVPHIHNCQNGAWGGQYAVAGAWMAYLADPLDGSQCPGLAVVTDFHGERENKDDASGGHRKGQSDMAIRHGHVGIDAPQG
ncbi:MAG: ABC transporter permease [Candidatus Sulfotelmatobacter sp.]